MLCMLFNPASSSGGGLCGRLKKGDAERRSEKWIESAASVRDRLECIDSVRAVRRGTAWGEVM